jgi:HK97 family phage prohead protease
MRESRFWRVPDAELRANANGTTVLAGYGAVFMRYSQNMGGFVEQIAYRAFNDVLARTGPGANVQGLVNHDMNWLLSDTQSGTLALAADEIGLRYMMELDESDPDAVRAMAKVRTRKMRGSSFTFTVAPGGDEWGLTEQGFPLRTLRSVSGLYDVGPVGSPAYLDTEGDGLAVALASLAESRNLTIGQAVDAARRNELRSLLAEAPAPEAPAEAEAEEAEKSVDVEAEAQHAGPEIDHNRTRLVFGLPTT